MPSRAIGRETRPSLPGGLISDYVMYGDASFDQNMDGLGDVVFDPRPIRVSSGEIAISYLHRPGAIRPMLYPVNDS